MIKSRYDFYYDLSQSPNRIVVASHTFVFPSVKRLSMFQNKYDLHRERLERTLSNTFHVDVDCGLLAALSLYEVIQPSPGAQFIITPDGEVITCLKDQKLDGLRLSCANSEGTSEPTTPPGPELSKETPA